MEDPTNLFKEQQKHLVFRHNPSASLTVPSIQGRAKRQNWVFEALCCSAMETCHILFISSKGFVVMNNGEVQCLQPCSTPQTLFSGPLPLGNGTLCLC